MHAYGAMKNRLKEERSKLGLTQAQVADRIGRERQAVIHHEKGKELSTSLLKKYAKLYNCSVSYLIGEDDAPQKYSAYDYLNPTLSVTKKKLVPVCAYIGAGGEVFPIDDYAKGQGMEEVEWFGKEEASELVAVKVKGDSMRPFIEDGWILFYRRQIYGMNPDCMNKLCVMKIKNDKVIVKKLRKGYKKGAYNLESFNADLIEDVELEWCAKIIDFRQS